MSAVRDSIARFVLQSESNTIRFEDFCNALLTEVEGGLPILSTSRTHDMARDGRSLGGSSRIYSCVSLNVQVQSKAKKDIARIISTTRKIDKLYFCSSQELTEKKADQLKAELGKQLNPETEIEVCGLVQVAQLAVRYPKIFEDFYKAELEQCLALLSGPDEHGEPENRSLQLALATLGNESSDSIRAEVYKGSLRLALAEKGRSLNECCKLITDLLRLHSLLPADALLPHLEALRESDELIFQDGTYSLTSKGISQIEAQQSNALDNLARGRQSIREQIETNIGYKLADTHFDQIWRIVQEKLAYTFFQRGQEMVMAVSRFLERQDLSGEDLHEPLFFVEGLAGSIASTASGPLAEELRVAFKDLFQEPVGPAFDWLSGVCGAFVVLCSLGIEAQSGDAIAKILAKTDLIIDTDVCLSLLGIGEVNHEAVETLVKRWKILGGGLWVSREVLEEVTYHAYIADVDFQNVATWLPSTATDRIQLIENVFVRSFAELLSKRKANRHQWRSYIDQFKGAHKYDIDNVAAVLREEYGFNVLPEHSAEDEELRKKACEYLISKIGQSQHRDDDLRIAEDKAKRDATLFASITTFRREMRNRDSERSCLFVSSARRMTELERRFSLPGDPNLVVSVAIVVHLTSLVPKVSIGLKSMRAFLFDARRIPFSSDLDRVVLRVVRDSKEFHMPWAKRHTLVREVRKRLIDNAKMAGASGEMRASELFKNLAEKRELEPLAEILRDSLNAIVIDRHIEIENAELRRRLEELTEEVERLRRSR